MNAIEKYETACRALDNGLMNLGDFEKEIAPLRDVAPVVHAHWIRHENADTIEGYYVPKFECSNCKAWKDDDSDFCPDCGAKMDAKIKKEVVDVE